MTSLNSPHKQKDDEDDKISHNKFNSQIHEMPPFEEGTPVNRLDLTKQSPQGKQILNTDMDHTEKHSDITDSITKVHLLSGSPYVYQLTDVKSHLATDISIVDIASENQDIQPNYELMIKNVKKNHPHKDDNMPFTCKDVCCDVNTGYNVLWKTSEKSDLEKYGVGIVLYFKYLKTLICFFTIFALFAIPNLVFNMNAYNSALTSDSSSKLFSTTLGTLGLGNTACGEAQIPQWNSTSTANTVNLSCPYGPILNNNQISFGYSTLSQTCSSLTSADIKRDCNNLTQTQLLSVLSSCFGQYTCSFSLQNSYFNLNTTMCTRKLTSNFVVFVVPCRNDQINFQNNQSVAKQTVSYVMTSFDAAIIIIYFIMIVSLRYARENTVNKFQQNTLSVSAYSLEITNLPSRIPKEELCVKLWRYIEERINEKNSERKNEIVDLQIVLPSKLEDLKIEYKNVIAKRATLTMEWIMLYAKKYENITITFTKLTELMDDYCNDDKNDDRKDAKKRYEKIKRLRQRKKQIEIEINNFNNNPDTRVVAAFVTFNTLEAQIDALEIFNMTAIQKFFHWIFGCFYDKNSKKYFERILLNVNKPDDPSNIIWSNLEMTFKQKMLRRSLSALITLALWFTTGLVVLICSNIKTQYQETYPSPNCSGVNPTQQEVVRDYVKYSKGFGLLQCYCLIDLSSRINTVFTGYGKLCLKWTEDQAIISLITFAVVFAVIVTNTIIQFIFTKLSSFERHKTKTEEISSRILKIFLAQFLNTGIIILLLNAKLNTSNDDYFFRGTYRDITSAWYIDVGSTILTTMLINAFTVPGTKLLFWLFYSCRRCYDRRWSKDLSITRKKLHKEYENLYTGKEFRIDIRYAQVLNLLYVCFLYNSGIPFLYITALVQLFLTYYVDKFLLLKSYKTPINFDEKMDELTRNVMFLSIILHLPMAIWVYGNPTFFQRNSGDDLSSIFGDISNDFDQTNTSYTSMISLRFFKTKQNYILLILFVILSGILIFKGLLYETLRRCLLIFRGNRSLKKNKIIPLSEQKNPDFEFDKSSIKGEDMTYLSLLDNEQLNALIKLNKQQLTKIANDNYRKLLASKIQKMQDELNKKANSVMIKGDFNKETMLVGLYTYDIRENPAYKEIYEEKYFYETCKVEQVE